MTPGRPSGNPGEIDAWLAAAVVHRQASLMRPTFQLLRYTAQRPSDVLRMTAASYNGEKIQVRQAKTGTLVWIPTHRDLAVESPQRLRSADLHLVGHRPTPVPYSSIVAWFAEIRRSAGLDERDLQMRDLRRTAAVRLSETGCTVPEISAITGHTIEQTQELLETYIPRTFEMPTNAVRKWERR